MKKTILTLIAAASLSACMETGGVAVTQSGTLSMSCPGSAHMQTMGGLPMRCGPQTVSPYAFQ